MSQPAESTVEVNGHACRVWTKGNGPRVGFLAGLGGLPRWLPFLDELAKRRTVVAPSLPGYPGATGHTALDTHLDWILAVRQLLDGAGLAGADLVGASVGGSFAAEMAAIFPASVRKLVLIAPFGLFDEAEPAADPWAQRKEALPGLMCADPARWHELVAPPVGANSVEWPIEMSRAQEAAARAFWPLGNTRLDRRLGLIATPTLVLWGEKDAVLPTSYAKKVASAIKGPTKTATISGAGHLAYLDQPLSTARAVDDHLS
ncbi:MAG: alpha/beta fold hydrolase [Enhydrobacter sp.]|nr:MAG: alpha/beta fold hydrolase [Enhydrobacter sp.]